MYFVRRNFRNLYVINIRTQHRKISYFVHEILIIQIIFGYYYIIIIIPSLHGDLTNRCITFYPICCCLFKNINFEVNKSKVVSKPTSEFRYHCQFVQVCQRCFNIIPGSGRVESTQKFLTNFRGIKRTYVHIVSRQVFSGLPPDKASF